MKIELDYEDTKRIKDLIKNRIDEIRYDIVDEMNYGEDELRQVIREYKSLLKKIDEQVDKIGIAK